MTIDTDISRLKLQEDTLRFKSLTEEDAWQLGSAMRTLASERKLPLVIDIRLAGRLMFYAALPGTAPDNAEWARRKSNAVMRFHACTYRIALETKKSGKPFDETRGLNPLEYAPAGGGFPVNITGAGVVGAACVSGIPQRDDHNFVAEAISRFLNVDYARIALPPEV